MKQRLQRRRHPEKELRKAQSATQPSQLSSTESSRSEELHRLDAAVHAASADATGLRHEVHREESHMHGSMHGSIDNDPHSYSTSSSSEGHEYDYSSSSSSSSSSASSDDEEKNENDSAMKYRDHVVPTLCEVHPENGVIEPDNNYDNMKDTYFPWLPYESVIFHTLHTHKKNAAVREYRPVILLKRVHLTPSSAALNRLLRDMCSRLCYKVSRMLPCAFTGLDVQVRLPGEDVVEICLSAIISFNPDENPLLLNKAEQGDAADALLATASNMPPMVSTGKRLFAPSYVFLTPLNAITGYHVKRYCGLVVLHFIRETWHLEEQASMNRYSHKFLLEVLAVAKAHVKCIGGNALLSVRILPQETAEEDVNQAYSMITISGDAAFMEED